MTYGQESEGLGEVLSQFYSLVSHHHSRSIQLTALHSILLFLVFVFVLFCLGQGFVLCISGWLQTHNVTEDNL